MKNFILIIILIVSSKLCFSQNLNFTNQNLKNYLLSENSVDLDGDEIADTIIDINGDNEIQFTEALTIQKLVISPIGGTVINSLQDISQFNNLKRLTIYGDFGLTDVSNLNMDSLEYIRISDHNSITDINLSDLPSLNSILLEGLSGLNSLNIQNGSYATQNFSLFYTYFNSACVDSIQAEYDFVAQHILNGGTPSVNCTLGINENKVDNIQVYPNPANNEIKVTTNLVLNKITIYEINGKSVYKGTLLNNSVNTNELNSGIYLLLFETENGESFKHKLIIE